LIRCLLQSGNPRVVNLTSGAGIIATKRNPRYYAYSISKAALNMLTRHMEVDLRAFGVCVVAITPGRVKTSMGDTDAPITAEQCAQSLAVAIEELTMANCGKLLDRFSQPCFDATLTDADGEIHSAGW